MNLFMPMRVRKLSPRIFFFFFSSEEKQRSLSRNRPTTTRHSICKKRTDDILDDTTTRPQHRRESLRVELRSRGTIEIIRRKIQGKSKTSEQHCRGRPSEIQLRQCRPSRKPRFLRFPPNLQASWKYYSSHRQRVCP